MIELTQAARQRLDDYLTELRLTLSEYGSVDPNEVERDIRDHIQAALSEAAAPVDVPLLEPVLRTLGAPADWIEEGQMPWFRRLPREWLAEVRRAAIRAAQRLAVGPESYRLPYLAFLAPAVGWSVFALSGDGGGLVVAIIGMLAGFVFARAALAIQVDRRPSVAQWWLLSPSLLAVYVPLFVSALVWPIVIGFLGFVEIQVEQQAAIRRWQQETKVHEQAVVAAEARLKRLREDPYLSKEEEQRVAANLKEAQEALAQRGVQQVHQPWGWEPTTARIAAATGAGGGLWWLILGQAAWWRPGWIRGLFRPFADRYSGRSGLYVSLLGTLALGASLLLFA